MKSVISSTPSPLYASHDILEELPALALADQSVPTVSEAASVDYAIEVATSSGTHALPVIDDSLRLSGLVFVNDALYESRVDATVADVFTPFCPVLPATANAAQAAAVMAFESLSWIPIVDDDQRVLGVVTALEIMRWLARNVGYHV